MTFGQRLRRARQEAGLEVKDVARMAGMSRTAIYDMERGEKMGSSKTATMAKTLGVSAYWLETGEGPMRLIAQQNVFDRAISNVTVERSSRKVPLLTFNDVRLLKNMEVDLESAEDWIVCPAESSEHTFALRIAANDESMVSPHGKSYPPNTVIYVDPAQRAARSGDKIIAYVNGCVSFKVYAEEAGRKWLRPLNPQHPIISDPFTIVGIVIGAFLPE